MKLKEIFPVKKYRPFIIGILLIVFVLYIINGWFAAPAKAPAGQGSHPAVKEEKGAISRFFSSIFEEKNKEADTADSGVDPALEKVTVEELPVDTTDMHPEDPESREIEGVIAVITEPLASLNKKLSSFVYEGNMTIDIPTLTRNESDFKAGKRYGKPIKVTSSFVYRKDEKGNWTLRQKTACAVPDTRYSTPLMNGELTWYKGSFFFRGKDGTRVDEDALKGVVSEFSRYGREPLVRNNWIKIVKDIKSVIGFDVVIDDENKRAYTVKGIHPRRQQKTILLSGLRGRIEINSRIDSMVNGTLTGKNTYRQFYIKGSTSTYSITLRIHSIGSASLISAP